VSSVTAVIRRPSSCTNSTAWLFQVPAVSIIIIIIIIIIIMRVFEEQITSSESLVKVTHNDR